MIRRLLLVIPTLWAIITINFFIVQIAPGGPVDRAGRRWRSFSVMNRFPANGTPGPPGICHWRKASFAWRCVRRK
ncbi:hypothetical protein CQA88_30075 [Klebsiella pneumoniae]|nr:hypothetical protein CQA88_30075 [Klebsiella pneumoniae]